MAEFRVTDGRVYLDGVQIDTRVEDYINTLWESTKADVAEIERLRAERNDWRSSAAFRLALLDASIEQTGKTHDQLNLLMAWYQDAVAQRDEARAWARMMKAQRDEARALYDGLVTRVGELDDAIADWRYENEKLRRALQKAIEERDEANAHIKLGAKELLEAAEALGLYGQLLYRALEENPDWDTEWAMMAKKQFAHDGDELVPF